jgi:hypothetical protein
VIVYGTLCGVVGSGDVFLRYQMGPIVHCISYIIYASIMIILRIFGFV